MVKRTLNWTGAFAALLLLSACGEEPPAPTPAPVAKAPKPVPLTPAQIEANKLLATMVSAVKVDESPAIATVKFELQARPELEKPLLIRLAFVPQNRAETLNATYVSEGPLAVPPTQGPASFTGADAGVAYFHELTVVPKSKGAHYVSAVVQIRLATGETQTQTFSIPVIVWPKRGA